ncbi:phage repressor protein [Salmonella enterica subsp. enterica]|uniref:phage repressor protein CI n=1 Tax=Citrobacter TaxID=544 RepID=UPI00137C7485|nr:phage repressor protein [Salmonella enterica subsp. enterica serovar Napoli]ECP8318274.1 phage repressor protein [Salmonella enterica subsp. enterica serovar Poona]EDV4482250.1 phage repressor protein [Salmonella enterica]EEJ7587464.1 phage repressor protein [Salmonella enterica subsp. enterica]EDV1250937.1 phage repressor protein [Salmonella enterica subsp. enterica serovar Poona]
MKIDTGANTGGKAAIKRLMEVYGFNTQIALVDHLEASKSTMANRLLRDSFPADWVIQCALETGASLLWLTTGQGDMYPQNEDKNNSNNERLPTLRPLSKIVVPSVKQATIENGRLNEQEDIFLDRSLIPGEAENCLYVKAADGNYVVDTSTKQLSNGVWLIDIDGMKNIVKIARIPGNKIIVHQDETSFECSVDDVEAVGRAVKIIKSI